MQAETGGSDHHEIVGQRMQGDAPNDQAIAQTKIKDHVGPDLGGMVHRLSDRQNVGKAVQVKALNAGVATVAILDDGICVLTAGVRTERLFGSARL